MHCSSRTKAQGSSLSFQDLTCELLETITLEACDRIILDATYAQELVQAGSTSIAEEGKLRPRNGVYRLS